MLSRYLIYHASKALFFAGLLSVSLQSGSLLLASIPKVEVEKGTVTCDCAPVHDGGVRPNYDSCICNYCNCENYSPVYNTVEKQCAECRSKTADNRILHRFPIPSYQNGTVQIACTQGYACRLDYDMPFPMFCLANNGAKDGSTNGDILCFLLNPVYDVKDLSIEAVTCCAYVYGEE